MSTRPIICPDTMTYVAHIANKGLRVALGERGTAALRVAALGRRGGLKTEGEDRADGESLRIVGRHDCDVWGAWNGFR